MRTALVALLLVMAVAGCSGPNDDEPNGSASTSSTTASASATDTATGPHACASANGSRTALAHAEKAGSIAGGQTPVGVQATGNGPLFLNVSSGPSPDLHRPRLMSIASQEVQLREAGDKDVVEVHVELFEGGDALIQFSTQEYLEVWVNHTFTAGRYLVDVCLQDTTSFGPGPRSVTQTRHFFANVTLG